MQIKIRCETHVKRRRMIIMTAKVEGFCSNKRTKSISVDRNERACINCIWYEQHYRPGRGNVATFVPTSIGHCLLDDKTRGALRQPCKRYETGDD